ncbi:MAG: MTAP family purine nucleoside phosphorylase [Gammaproteobacteria bacterium]|nr:MAG: MTAP family purine nucleoside phosphorylase [Gammaproteobacteria bacterium]
MIGIIGGTGLYRMAELQVTEVREVSTPFGPPSSPVMLGVLGQRRVAFLARHGLHHDLLPSEINFRGNIWALKSVGVRTVIVRAASFFGRGLVAHISTAQPVCRATAALIARSARSLGMPVHEDRTYACVEGPRLGTRAESFFLRGAGADIVGMTNVPEAFLALEAQLGYCTIALATDYDCWLDDAAQHVSAEQVIGLFRSNLTHVQRLIAQLTAEYVDDESRPCRRALRSAVVTPREQMTNEQRAVVDFLAA